MNNILPDDIIEKSEIKEFLNIPNNSNNSNNGIICDENTRIKIRFTLNRKWYKLLFQYVTFGIYKAKYEYKCKVVIE